MSDKLNSLAAGKTKAELFWRPLVAIELVVWIVSANVQ